MGLESFSERARASVRAILLEVVRFCVKHEIKFQVVVEELRVAFLTVAEEKIAAESATATNSRIADLTGLSRKNIAKGRSTHAHDTYRDDRDLPCGMVLKIWHNDNRYQDGSGAPVSIPLESTQGPSIRAIVESIDAKLDFRAVLDELLRSGSVRAVESGLYGVTARTYIMPSSEASAVDYFGIAGSNLLATLNHNTSADVERVPMFERTAWSSSISNAAFVRFAKIVNETSKPFLELVDDWLDSHDAGESAGEGENVVGVGVYVFRRHRS